LEKFVGKAGSSTTCKRDPRWKVHRANKPNPRNAVLARATHAAKKCWDLRKCLRGGVGWTGSPLDSESCGGWSMVLNKVRLLKAGTFYGCREVSGRNFKPVFVSGCVSPCSVRVAERPCPSQPGTDHVRRHFWQAPLSSMPAHGPGDMFVYGLTPSRPSPAFSPQLLSPPLFPASSPRTISPGSSAQAQRHGEGVDEAPTFVAFLVCPALFFACCVAILIRPFASSTITPSSPAPFLEPHCPYTPHSLLTASLPTTFSRTPWEEMGCLW
jgi:hypothetical protein